MTCVCHLSWRHVRGFWRHVPADDVIAYRTTSCLILSCHSTPDDVTSHLMTLMLRTYCIHRRHIFHLDVIAYCCRVSADDIVAHLTTSRFTSHLVTSRLTSWRWHWRHILPVDHVAHQMTKLHPSTSHLTRWYRSVITSRLSWWSHSAPEDVISYLLIS